MNIKPLGNRVVVTLEKQKKTSASGIILTTKDENEQSLGTITAIGAGQGDDENVTELGLKVGDTVLFGKYAGEEIKDSVDSDKIYKILKGSDILAIINN
jgi:chaperonin GroES